MTLDLTVDLYEACQQISPRHPDYATLSIEDGFEWASLSCCLFERLYLVAFRSVWRPEADFDLLREHGECLSFCLWETRHQARRAADAALHRSAAGVSVQMYLSYSLERYWIRKVGSKLVFEPIQK